MMGYIIVKSNAKIFHYQKLSMACISSMKCFFDSFAAHDHWALLGASDILLGQPTLKQNFKNVLEYFLLLWIT